MPRNKRKRIIIIAVVFSLLVGFIVVGTISITFLYVYRSSLFNYFSNTNKIRCLNEPDYIKHFEVARQGVGVWRLYISLADKYDESTCCNGKLKIVIYEERGHMAGYQYVLSKVTLLSTEVYVDKSEFRVSRSRLDPKNRLYYFLRFKESDFIDRPEENWGNVEIQFIPMESNSVYEADTIISF